MRITDTSDLWWKNAVLYCVDIETFNDANGDGIGDLQGLVERIDYLAELGITCLWLMPFYPSPQRDGGYDITDHLGVDPRLGDLGQLVEVIRTAHDRGMRVIADLVVNHTSSEHPWFVEACRSVESPFHDYYVWRTDDPGDTAAEVVFPDQETSLWQRNEATGDYYLHHFYRFQPDLNLANRAVREQITRAIGLWLELGFDGFRVDGVPFLGQTTKEAGDPRYRVDGHEFMREVRGFVSRRRGDSMMVGEVNLPRGQQLEFFGGDDANELQMQFDFITMQATWLSLARRDARPLVKALEGRPPLDRTCQWAVFLRNHDELTLDKLTDRQRQEVFDAFGPDADMQIYGRGLKRRLPPMLEGDPRRIRMAYSLMFSLPGTPSIFYGEEIGMGEDLAGEGRMAVRTPMQWTSGANGGFSTADADRLQARVVQGSYGPDHVNVADQIHDPDSLWNWMRHLIRIRRTCPELGWGELTVLQHDAGPQVLAHRVDTDDSGVLTVHNLSPDAVSATIAVTGFEAVDADRPPRVVDLFTNEVVGLEDGRLTVPLDGYGVRWLRVRPATHLAIP